MYRVKLSSNTIKGKSINGIPITTEWKYFKEKNKEMVTLEKFGEIIVEEVGDTQEDKKKKDENSTDETIVPKITVEAIEDENGKKVPVIKGVREYMKKERKERDKKIMELYGPTAVDAARIQESISLATKQALEQIKPLSIFLKQIPAEAIAQQTLLKQILKPWRNLNSETLSVIQLIKELEKDSQRFKEHFKTAGKIVPMDVSKFKPDLERIKTAPPIETKPEPEPVEATPSPETKAEPEPVEATPPPEAEAAIIKLIETVIESVIKSEYEKFHDYLKSIINAFITAHKNDQEKKKELTKKDREIEKIRWYGKDRELVYLFKLLIEMGFLEEDKKFKMMADHFQKKSGKEFNHRNLSNAYQQMSIDPKYKRIDEVAKNLSNFKKNSKG